jgi:hypothetical protein
MRLTYQRTATNSIRHDSKERASLGTLLPSDFTFTQAAVTSRTRAADCYDFTFTFTWQVCNSQHHTQRRNFPKHPTMALAIAKSDTAHYLHATLERFETVAIQDISRLFYAAAAHVAVEQDLVELSYDERHHVFILKHHNCFGGQLDEALGRIIRNYVASETEAVTRFEECTLGDPLDDDDIGSEQSEARGEEDQALTTHVVNYDGINTYGKAKAFHLHELPQALRNRAMSRHNIEHLAIMISLRHVQLDPKNEQHVFGGSIGNTLPKLSSAEQDGMHYLLHQILSFSPFTPKVRMSAPRDAEPEAGHRRFSGKEPAIGQWLEGMGETRQIDPEVQPEMGGEQFKFARSRTMQNDSLGRVRKPKGVSLADHQLPEGQPLEQPDAKPSAGFAALMRSGAIGDASSETDSSVSDEANPFEGMKQVKVVELAKSDDASTSGGAFTPSSTSRDREQSVFTIATRTANALGSGSHQTRSQIFAATPSSQGAPRSEGGFPTDGRSYAKADRWGLTGDAANHVAWEKENRTSLLAQHARRAPRTYDDLASTRAESAASVSGGESRMGPVPIAAVTPMSYSETPLGGNEPWAKNVVRPDVFVPTGTLVNTDVTIADTSRSKAPQYPPGLVNTYASVANTSRPKPPHYPPGCYPPLGSNEQPTIVNATNTARAPQAIARPRHQTALQTLGREMSTKLIGQGNVDLMSFNDADNSTKIAAQEDDNLMAFNDDAPFIERGKAQDEEPPRLHRTMRQQAGGSKNKQQKKKSSKASTNRSTPSRPAVLELPSPPPPPKPKPSTVVKVDAKAQGPIEPERDLHLEQVINEQFSYSSLDGKIAGVEVQFGLALMTDAEDLIAERGLRSEDMQEKLDELPPQKRNTMFPLCLGRQREDGVYLLMLPTTLSGSVSPYAGDALLLEAWSDGGPHGLSDRRLYEINIAVPGGAQWLLVFEHDTPENVDIRLLKDSQERSSIYIHYPERVWDARIRPRSTTPARPELDKDLERNIKTFLMTFDSTRGAGGAGTEDGLPDFEAVVPDNVFIVTKILVKRELTRTLLTCEPKDTTDPPPSWTVSEVWDLHVQPSFLSRAAGGGNSLAIFAKDEKTMRTQGRLWWEASLVYDEVPQKDRGLETLLKEIVAKLDSVGMPPVVPVRAKPEAEKNAKQEYVPYW